MRLDLFSQQRLHEALEAGGYKVSHRTVRRWVEGDAIPDAAWTRAILDVMGITKEAAPPEWAERLEAKVDQLVIGAIVDPEHREVVRRLAARLGVLPKPSSEGFDDLPGTGAPGGAAPTALEPS